MLKNGGYYKKKKTDQLTSDFAVDAFYDTEDGIYRLRGRP